MRLPLLAALIAFACAPSLAQSGTITVPASYTNSVTDIGALLPQPNAGMNRVRLTATSKFDQGLTVVNGAALPVNASCVFTNRVELRSGSIVLASDERQTSILGLVCDFGTTRVRRSQFAECAVTFSLNSPQPWTLHNTTRATVTTDFLGDGTVYHQTTSRAGTDLAFEFLP